MEKIIIVPLTSKEPTTTKKRIYQRSKTRRQLLSIYVSVYGCGGEVQQEYQQLNTTTTTTRKTSNSATSQRHTNANKILLLGRSHT